MIEIIRNLIKTYGAPKAFTAIKKAIYEKLLPPFTISTNQNEQNICPNPSIFRKFVHSLNAFKLCKRKPHTEEQEDLLANYSKLKMTPQIDIELGETPIVVKRTSSVHQLNMNSLNTYDIFKVLSTITMFIDHYGYFGLPGLSSTQSRWFRVIGRFAAPGFFFLAGWSSKKFRMKTWCAAVFTYVFTSVVPLGFVHSPWESIMNIALINCIFYFIPPHRIRHPLVHCLIFCALQYYRNYASSALNIGYGTIPFILAIGGDLMKHKHPMRFLWIAAGMISFGYSSISVFAANRFHTIAIITECVINGVFMLCFAIKEVQFLNKANITMIARDGLIWMSRTGLLVYIGHLALFKLISMTYYAGGFNSMLY